MSGKMHRLVQWSSDLRLGGHCPSEQGRKHSGGVRRHRNLAPVGWVAAHTTQIDRCGAGIDHRLGRQLIAAPINNNALC